MSRKILIIGGTYFAGRVFAMLASRNAGFELTFVNRGRYSMGHLPNVTEYRADRHDPAALQALPAGEYDAIVDFCAYAPGEIRTVLENLGGRFGKYIYLSTADVYDRSTPAPWTEDSPVVSAQPAGPAGESVYNKMLLEAECRSECEKRGIASVILRPSFIYGPYNYAPRESFYVQKICRGEAIPHPVDARSQFQFVYVKDVALAIIACIDRECRGAYNLAAPEIITYDRYLEVLRKVSDRPFEVQNVTVQQVIEENIPVPFPLTPEESELFDGSRAARELGIEYTPLDSAMVNTYNAFKSVFSD